MAVFLKGDRITTEMLIVSCVWNTILLLIALSMISYFWFHPDIRLPNWCRCFTSDSLARKLRAISATVEISHGTSVAATATNNNNDHDPSVQPSAVSHTNHQKSNSNMPRETDIAQGNRIDLGWPVMICMVVVSICNIFICITDGYFHSSLIFNIPITDSYCAAKISTNTAVFMLHKTMIYFIFSYRVQNSFEGSVFDFPSYTYQVFRLLAVLNCIAASIATPVQLHSNFRVALTTDGNVETCYAHGTHFIKNFSGIILLAIVGTFDSIYSFGSLYAYLSRLKKVVSQAMSVSQNVEMAQSFHAVMKKSAVLVVFAVISTSISVTCLMLEANFCVFNETLDLTMNSICVFLLFRLDTFSYIYDHSCGSMFATCFNLDVSETGVGNMSSSVAVIIAKPAKDDKAASSSNSATDGKTSDNDVELAVPK